MTAVDPGRTAPITGSIAAASFAAAVEVVRAGPVGGALPLRFVPPPAGGAAAVARDPQRKAPGPLRAALTGLRAGTTTAVALLEGCLAAIDARDGALMAMVAVDAPAALAAAAQADDAGWTGPLHGIPLTVKDVIDVAGLPTRCGSAAYLDHPVDDAAAVGRLRAAGAVVVGKASTHEFAMGVTSPQSRNPWDDTRIPGGSSGGSAISVATGMALGSLGTDTRASIRVPAALSGVVGLKATLGAVPTRGVVPLSWTMDHAAPMARTVGDAALLLDVLLADGRALGTVQPGRRLRLGVAEAAFADCEAPLEATVRAALDALARAGAVLIPSTRPSADDLALANAAGLVVSRCEAATSHRSLGLDRSRFWEEVGDQLDAADDLLAIDYLQAQRQRSVLAADLLAAFDDVDLLVMPTSPVTAPLATDFAAYLMLLARNAIPFSFVGFPAMSVPCGFAAGLPVGLQLVAPPGREDLLIAGGRALEDALDR